MRACYIAGVTNAAVLVLNRHYQPIHVTNVRRAFSLLYLGVARVIDPEFKTFDFESWAELSVELHNGDFIRTVNRAIRVPRVIVLQLYDRIPKTKVRFSRHNIYMRDGNTCQYCGRERDQLGPRARGRPLVGDLARRDRRPARLVFGDDHLVVAVIAVVYEHWDIGDDSISGRGR